MDNIWFFIIFEIGSVIWGGITVISSVVALISGNAKSGVGIMFLIGIFLVFDFFLMVKLEDKLGIGDKMKSITEVNRIIKAILLVVSLVMFLGFSSSEPSKNDTNKWDKLTDEEKQWYIDNYGDGQYDEIQDAIEDYNGY